MYVMSSLPPAQQSLAGGIFNTVTKICAAIGLGITASIYNAESTGKAALQTTYRPYQMVFWFCVAAAGASICFVPFLTLGTQGNSTRDTGVADPQEGFEMEKKTEGRASTTKDMGSGTEKGEDKKDPGLMVTENKLMEEREQASKISL
jgi:hypothetical protein